MLIKKTSLVSFFFFFVSLLFSTASYANLNEFALGDLEFQAAPPDLQNQCPQYTDGDLNDSYRLNSAPSLEEIGRIFKTLPYGSNRFRNQCYMRAHIWSYKMWRNYGLKSLKIFLFFANPSRMRSQGWWFHAAPIVIDDQGQSWVMDRQFTKGPLSIENWLEVFLKTGTRCPVINHYQIYEDNKKSFDCFVRIVPMYYLQPLDVQNADGSRRAKVQEWNLWELKTARKHFPFSTRRNIIIDRLR